MTERRKLKREAILAGMLSLWAAGATATMVTTADGTEVPDIGPLPPVEANPDNAPTEARLELGRALFFDNRISASGTMNCATCHLPHQGWTVHTPLSPANPGRVERRNSPTLINVGYNKALIWDGRAWPLEKQAIGSTKNPVHKGQDIDKLMAIFKEDEKMVKMFKDAYGSEPNPVDYGKALAVFQRHFIVTGPSPFDRYAEGDTSAMDEAVVRGMALFMAKANCIACHNGPNFTDSGFYNIGLKHNPILNDEAHQKVLKFDAKRTKNADWEAIATDPGRYLITHEESDWGRFKTPTLRNLVDTLPYMHDGRHWTLEEVIDHYDRGGDGTRNQDPRIKPLNLTDREKQDLKAFLSALRGPLPDIRMEDWVRPAAAAEGLDGKALFEGKATCVNCHQADGKGVSGVFPPLAGNPRVQEGDGSYVAQTIIHGRSGKISVHGKVFNAIMPPIGTQQGLSDAEIAAVATYVRNAWGNQATAANEEIVRQQR
jgi:cytochrome c peroxidase